MAKRKKDDGPAMEQGYIEGTAPPRIKAIDQAAKVYYAAMTERKAIGEEEKEAQLAIIDEMHKAGLKIYECFDGKVVTLTENSKINVKPKKLQEGEKGEEE